MLEYTEGDTALVLGEAPAKILNAKDVKVAVARFKQGDWGDIISPDRAEKNEVAHSEGGEIVGIYTDSSEKRFSIVRKEGCTDFSRLYVSFA